MPLIHGFFKLIEAGYADAGIKSFTVQDKPVRFYHGFQSVHDLRNDLQAILIKPLVNFYISNIYQLNVVYELYLSAIHFITLSPECLTHLSRAVHAIIFSALCYCFIVTELLTQTLSFAMRLGMTGTHTMTSLFTPKTPEVSKNEEVAMPEMAVTPS